MRPQPKKQKPDGTAGDKISQNQLGLMYGEGRGVKKDMKQSLKWIEKVSRL